MAASRLDLVLLWHMHQPDYRDRGAPGNAEGEFVLPWTYLHAIKDYTDMVAHLERHPRVRAVVNFVPVLVDQILDYVHQFETGKIRDPLLALLAREDMDALTLEERRFLLDSCFHHNHLTMLHPFPRYVRLHELYRAVEGQGDGTIAYLSGDYFSDLITWYHLVWIGETERRRHPLMAELLAKAHGFTPRDRQRLFKVIGDLMRTLMPRYRALAQAGRIEISSTPYAHPLAPLLIDLKSGREALPDLPLPQHQTYPGGRARVSVHVTRGISTHERNFGQPPRGIWPAEGAVSTPLMQLLSTEGCQWAATSESVLVNSLRRAGNGSLPPRNAYLYRGYRIEGAPGLATFFRDEHLSDLIGFEYARWHGRDAAQHFIAQLEAIARDAQGDEVPVVSVILDGENAWEYYPYNGFYFFDDLYGLLEDHPTIHTTTYAEYLSRNPAPSAQLPGLVAGSWVQGTLTTWVGDPDKNRAWDLLCAAKQAYDLVMSSERLSEQAREAAEQQLTRCESSDWFWWLGPYNPGHAVSSFDRLFRVNLTRLYELLELAPPPELSRPLSRGGGAAEGGGTMRRAT
jgi:alpha-amylase/alpha-mannosidase (GH57 family)